MSEQKAFYIVTVAGGKCLENTARGVLDCLPKDSNKSQHWVVEAGEEANTVAFKNVADGQYLRNNEPNKINWGKIGVGEKQWWTLEQGKTPGSCAIRSNACTSGKSYLNDFQGKYQDNNYVHMWQMEVCDVVLREKGMIADGRLRNRWSFGSPGTLKTPQTQHRSTQRRRRRMRNPTIQS